MSRISFLGLGAMGRRMARRLVDAGHDVTVWNRSSAPLAALQSAGARVASTPREAVEGAEFVIAMVLDDTASGQVWLDPAGGAAAALQPGAIALESSTLTPAWVQALGTALAARGVALVDAPVVGSRPQAESGQLIHLVGGDAAPVAAVRPLLGALGAAVHHVGPAGAGAWLKLAVNALFATQVVAVAEQLALLRRAGLDVDRLWETLRTLPVVSSAAVAAGTLMLAGEDRPQAPVDLIAKDLAYALQSATGPGAALPLTAAVKERFDTAASRGFGAANLVAVAHLYD
jgi:3-hydroxyisobutyrate dehydrogenase